jgi:hypothetical protein
MNIIMDRSFLLTLSGPTATLKVPLLLKAAKFVV